MDTPHYGPAERITFSNSDTGRARLRCGFCQDWKFTSILEARCARSPGYAWTPQSPVAIGVGDGPRRGRHPLAEVVAQVDGQARTAKPADHGGHVAVAAMQLDGQLVDLAAPGQILAGVQNGKLSALDIHFQQPDPVDAVGSNE